MQYSTTAMVKAMKLQDVISKAHSGKITWVQAAQVAGVSYRTIKRWKARYGREGPFGMWDRRMRRPSPKRAPLWERQRICRLYQERYPDFNVRHFHEQLPGHGIRRSYDLVRKTLREAGLITVYPRGGVHRKRRPRKALPGMMLHLDGSPHLWLPALSQDLLTLLVLLDDATNEIYEMALMPEEDTLGCMRLLRDCVRKQGLFCALYTDRAGHFFRTPKAGGMVQTDHQTQIGRALKTLGIQMIPSYCPQGRGRSERMNRTLQGRLPQELRLAGVKSLVEANRFLREMYLPRHNRRFCVKPEKSGSAFVPVTSGIDLDQIFSIQATRTVGIDNVVSFQGLKLQIEPSPLRVSFAKCKVIVHRQVDECLSLTYGPHVLGRYDGQGKPLRSSKQQVA